MIDPSRSPRIDTAGRKKPALPILLPLPRQRHAWEGKKITILFLLAVLFAIPTYGLSLLAFFAFVIIGAVLKAKARMHYANTQQAYRDVKAAFPPPPSAMQREPQRKVHPGNVDEYWNGVVKLCERNAIPAAYTNTIVTYPEFAEMFRVFLDSLENNGSSFMEQQMAGAEFIGKAWDRMDDDQKRIILDAARAGAPALDMRNVKL